MTVRRLAAAALAAALALSSALLASCARPEAAVILAGSTSVQPFAEALAQEYMKTRAGLLVEVQGGGSAAGILAAQSGTADIGMSSRGLKEAEKGLWSVEIAKDGLAVVVHPSNPVADLTLAQLRGIYTGAVTDWSQVGGAKGRIHVITREEGSGTRSAFVDLVMEKQEIDPRSIVQDSNGAVRQLVADDPGAIGYLSMGLVDARVKAVSLGGVAATREDVVNGTYGLSRPFLFVSDGEPAGEAKAFIDFVLSAEGQRLLEAQGLVAVQQGGAS
jgi:phosphate transport system substrate-binding protein